MAEVRDRFLLTKRKYEDLITQSKAGAADSWRGLPSESGPYEHAEVCSQHASM